MPILAKVNPATNLATVIYTAPEGRQPQVNLNVASVTDVESAFTIGVIKNADKAVSAVTITDGGKYTSKPNIVITGDKTTQAVTAVSTMKVMDVAINAGGSNYVVGNTLSVAGGTGTAATIRVDAIGAGGAITAASIVANGAYSVLPAQAANAVTGGAGTLAKFDLFFAINAIAVSNGGNGYNPATTTVAPDTTGQVVAAVLGLQFSTTFEPLLDTYHPLTRLPGRGAVERTGIVLGAGDCIVVKSEAANTINYIAMGYEDLA